MFLLDPDQGNRRRAFVRDKAIGVARVTGRSLRKASRDLSNRTRGVIAETRSRISPDSGSDDEILAERVRSKIGRIVSHPAAIQVSANNGTVTLRGDALQSEVRDLMSRVYSIRDVRDVRNELHTHASSAGISNLQGQQREMPQSFLPRTLRAPGTRMLLGASGGALAVYGATSRNTLGKILATAGLALLTGEIATTGFRRNGGSQQ